MLGKLVGSRDPPKAAAAFFFFSWTWTIYLLFLQVGVEGFPGGSGKESACDVGDSGSNLRSERAPGGGCGNPLQYLCLKNPMDRGARAAYSPWVMKRQTQLSDSH